MKKATVNVEMEVILKDDGSVEIHMPRQILSAAEFKSFIGEDTMHTISLVLSKAHQKYNYITFLKKGNTLDFSDYNFYGKTFDVYFLGEEAFDELSAVEELEDEVPVDTINAHNSVNRRFDAASIITSSFEVGDTIEMKVFTNDRIVVVKND